MTGQRVPTVVVAMHDGFYGHGTRAGRCNRALLDVLAMSLASQVRLVVAPIWLHASSPQYDPEWHEGADKLLTAMGGQVVPIDNGTRGRSRFAGLPSFRRASAALAEAVTGLLPSCGPLLVIASDAPFF